LLAIGESFDDRPLKQTLDICDFMQENVATQHDAIYVKQGKHDTEINHIRSWCAVLVPVDVFEFSEDGDMLEIVNQFVDEPVVHRHAERISGTGAEIAEDLPCRLIVVRARRLPMA